MAIAFRPGHGPRWSVDDGALKAYWPVVSTYCDAASKGGMLRGVCLFSRLAVAPASSRCCRMFGYAEAKPENARQTIDVDLILGDREVGMIVEGC